MKSMLFPVVTILIGVLFFGIDLRTESKSDGVLMGLGVVAILIGGLWLYHERKRALLNREPGW